MPNHVYVGGTHDGDIELRFLCPEGSIVLSAKYLLKLALAESAAINPPSSEDPMHIVRFDFVNRMRERGYKAVSGKLERVMADGRFFRLQLAGTVVLQYERSGNSTWNYVRSFPYDTVPDDL